MHHYLKALYINIIYDFLYILVISKESGQHNQINDTPHLVFLGRQLCEAE